MKGVFLVRVKHIVFLVFAPLLALAPLYKSTSLTVVVAISLILVFTLFGYGF